MIQPALTIYPDVPKLVEGSMLLAFTGWMDGGEVSTGTVKHLLSHLRPQPIATIDPEQFYIVNFPGSMELAALFRPYVRYEAGVIAEFERPANTFYCDASRNLVLFLGREPNLCWETFADCIFSLASQIGVTRIFFVGSFGGSVPHTREPRLYASVSRPELKSSLARYGLQWTDYDGPASFATLLLWRAGKLGIDMTSIAAEIPSYLQGPNPLCIESVTRRLVSILGLPVDMAAMRLASDEWQAQVTQLVANEADLAEKIHTMEEEYDGQLLDGD